MNAQRDGYTISTDRARLDRDVIHRFLCQDSYWSRGVPRDLVDRSIDNALCFGLYAPDGALAGFARAVTDAATVAYVGDVFVLEAHRGRGLGVWLMETLLAHPELQGLRRIELGTADAHTLYERFGFRPHPAPQDQLYLVRDPAELYGKPG